MLTLGIDTSGKTASVALCDSDKVIAQNTFLTNLTHSQIILPLVERMLKDVNISIKDVDAFAVAAGPGSYTGLRIGISAVKAMCFTLNKKCAGISTLESLAYNCIGTKVIIVSLMKARNDVAYYGIYKSDGKTLATLHEDSVQKIDEIIKILSVYKDDIILTGDYAEEIFNNYFKDNINISLAPVFERHQLATSLCFLAMQRGLSSPDELSASYLQITKAEKDKNTNNI